ncbi:MAG: DUF4157 domain-containing protein [Ferruginibacter sp.]
MSYRSRFYNHRNAQSPEGNIKKPFFRGKQASFEKNSTPAFFQTKLSVNEPGDQYEQEANSVADAVVNNKTGQPVIQQKAISRLQRLATSEEDEELNTNDERMKHDKDIQRAAIRGDDEENEKMSASVQMKSEQGETSASPQLSSQIESARGKGSPLPKNTLQEMNTSFGADFSNVNIHTDTESENMNKELNAQAFTYGSDIYFNSGKYDTNSDSGKQLLAHELTHAVQQGSVQREMLQRREENTQPLADVQGLAMYDLLSQLNSMTEDTLTDEEEGQSVGGSRLMVAMRAIMAKRNGSKNSFITNNQAILDTLPTDQVENIRNFLGLKALSEAPSEPAPEPTASPDPVPAPATFDVPTLDDLYNKAVRDARQSGDWKDAAEKLNGFSSTDIQIRLAQLTMDEVKSLHQGALDNPNVGPESNVAQMTMPAITPSIVQPVSTTVSDLDKQYTAAVQSNDWPTAAEKLNAFNADDIHTRLAQVTPEQIAKIHKGALDNASVGPDSQVAQLTVPEISPPSAANNSPQNSYTPTDKDLDELSNLMRQVNDLVDSNTLKTLIKNKTLAIALLVDEDGDIVYGYSLNGNWKNPSLETVMENLGLMRINFDSNKVMKGQNRSIGHAEQRMMNDTESEFEVKAMVVSRGICEHCQFAINDYNGDPILVRVQELEMRVTREESLSNLEDYWQTLSNSIERASSEHKSQLHLINDPSFIGFAGFWTNRLFNRDAPLMIIWSSTFSKIRQARVALDKKDPAAALSYLIDARIHYLAALKQYTEWKDGIEGATVNMEHAIEISAVAIVLAFVAPSIVEYVAEMAAEEASAAAEAQQTIAKIRVSIEEADRVFRIVDAAEKIADADEIERMFEIEEALRNLRNF